MKNYKYQLNYFDWNWKCCTRYYKTIIGVLRFLQENYVNDFLCTDMETLETVNPYDFL